MENKIESDREIHQKFFSHMKDFRNIELFARGIFESAHFGWVLDLYEITSRPQADFGNFSEIYPRTREISCTNVGTFS